MDWDKLRVFHAVAEAGSFTHAGETLNLSQSAVSRQISGLEERLRVPLFHRHARGLILTEQGEILYRTTREIFSKLAMTEAMLSEGREKPKGPLKITTTVAFGSTWLTPNIKNFVDSYPEIAVTLLVDDDELDLSMREADVAIRMAPPRQPDLIQRHLMNIHFHLFASPDYLKQFGEPKTPGDLAKHRLVIYGERTHLPFPDANWVLHLAKRESGVTVEPALTVNNYYAIYRACMTGIGIAALPDYMVRQDSELQQVLPEIEGPQVPAYFVYPEELRNSKRITVLREFLLQQVAAEQF
ncbi:MAG: LysR family transcriptional regulator [Alphaproteobacteria bacterium]|nr:LysR family transcriptional regulator [Alphaproteobacteria bacterium]MBU0798631.1 LysR family transcriptional regulator [Alphaproteobacteria bacterium]MBU0887009.1 LysR family transcriptional regulator [Alphaproteobacteria bacterium]MBU1811883.1 LysR family transcriptional regulator [Alphaproteobacteria bacterium]MBU2089855.1 LysR family transcriptional regulator [Alphaproteobacteria bacterium]